MPPRGRATPPEAAAWRPTSGSISTTCCSGFSAPSCKAGCTMRPRTASRDFSGWSVRACAISSASTPGTCPIPGGGMQAYRKLSIDTEAFDFSSGFTDLHTESYRRILAGEASDRTMRGPSWRCSTTYAGRCPRARRRLPSDGVRTRTPRTLRVHRKTFGTCRLEWWTSTASMRS